MKQICKCGESTINTDGVCDNCVMLKDLESADIVEKKTIVIVVLVLVVLLAIIAKIII